MKLSRRESILACLTGAVTLLVVTVWQLQPRLQTWRTLQEERRQWQQRQSEAEFLLSRRDEIARDLEQIMAQLPSHPEGRNVTADFLRLLEAKAQQHGVVFQRREAGRERHLGDLYEIAIQGGWEGTLPSLVRFLYALQEEGVILDVSQLTIIPESGTERMKGVYAVHFAYRREPAPVGTDPEAGRHRQEP